MLIHMIPEQVSQNWDFFAPVIEASLPPAILEMSDTMAIVLASILTEDLIIWVYVGDEDDQVKFILSTTTWADPVTGQKMLMVYTFTGIRDVVHSELIDAIDTLKRFAEANEMISIIAYTTDNTIVDVFKRLGYFANYTLLEIPV
jgi:hypothetical protein